MHVIQLGPVASFALVMFVSLFAIITVVLLAALAIVLTKLQQQVTKLTDKIEPVIVKVSATLDSVQRVTANVGEKADTILTRGEALTETLSQKVESTAGVVQETVTKPLINLSSLFAGLSKGFSAWGATQGVHTKNTNGSNGVDNGSRVE